MALPPLDELLVTDQAGWRDWLLVHHADSPGVRLVLTKKGGTTTSLSYEQAVLQALCFGWIDGQSNRRDEQTSLIRMTPRRPKSNWSASNVARVAQLEADGLMHEAGRAAVAAAQADGRWARAIAGSG